MSDQDCDLQGNCFTIDGELYDYNKVKALQAELKKSQNSANWNYIRLLQAENAKLREDIKAALLVSDSTNEINPSNYCEDDVLAVDNCVIEMHQILEAALDGKGGEG
jgi:hypothetical protein